jgi:hypothetical protein
MRRRLLLFLTAAIVLGAPSIMRAEPSPPTSLPKGSKPLSEILRPIEARSDFGYFDEVELEGGIYKIEFYTQDGSKQKMHIDPLPGTEREAGSKR